MIEIRRFNPQHIDFALAQTDREGWAASRAEFQILLEHDPEGCFIAASAGVPVGMVTTTRFGDRGWIGNLIVEPAQRGRGVGRALMERGMDRLRTDGASTFFLEADPPGVPLYRSMGFVEEFESSRYVLAELPDRTVTGSGDTSDMTIDDLDEVALLDSSACGASRGRYLQLKFRHSDVALVRSRGGSIVAALLGAATPKGFRIGPVVARDSFDARGLILTSISRIEQTPILIGVPSPNTPAAEMLTELGFRTEQPSMRMRLGNPVTGNRLNYVYAIASGAVG